MPTSKRPPFVMVMPPPNVTGSLHMGHMLNNTVHDVIVRRKRMQGFNTLWLPGMDHAGIATQNVVERELRKEGLTRHDLGREKFVERVWQWKEQYGGIILKQIRRIGSSCDWSRERFTLDEGLSRAVREVFVRLYEEGLIYRGKRLINWCPRCQTALSDLEMIYEPVDSKLYYIKYPLKGTAGRLRRSRYNAAGNDAGRHGRCRQSERRTIQEIQRPIRHPSADESRNSVHRRCAGRSSNSVPAS